MLVQLLWLKTKGGRITGGWPIFEKLQYIQGNIIISNKIC